MKYLLDTNVLSEWTKPRPDAGVVHWLAAVDEDDLYISVITLAELWYGAERLSSGKRKVLLQSWIRDEITKRFETRILRLEERIAETWGSLMARSEGGGRRMGVIDGFIAATATVHELTLVTRDAGAFRGFLSEVLNPWDSA